MVFVTICSNAPVFSVNAGRSAKTADHSSYNLQSANQVLHPYVFTFQMGDYGFKLNQFPKLNFQQKEVIKGRPMISIERLKNWGITRVSYDLSGLLLPVITTEVHFLSGRGCGANATMIWMTTAVKDTKKKNARQQQKKGANASPCFPGFRRWVTVRHFAPALPSRT